MNFDTHQAFVQCLRYMAIIAILPAPQLPEHRFGSHYRRPNSEDHEHSYAEGYHEVTITMIDVIIKV